MRLSKVFLVVLTFLYFSCAFGVVSTTISTLPHGYARLMDVANKTPYRMVFYQDPSALLDQLVNGARIQIQAQFKSKTRYFRVVKVDDMWKVVCDTTDKKDPATFFTVIKLTGDETFQLASAVTKDMVVKMDSATLELILEDAERGRFAQWELVGDDFDNCWLRNAGNKGFLTVSDATVLMNKLKEEIAKGEAQPYIIGYTENRTDQRRAGFKGSSAAVWYSANVPSWHPMHISFQKKIQFDRMKAYLDRGQTPPGEGLVVTGADGIINAAQTQYDRLTISLATVQADVERGGGIVIRGGATQQVGQVLALRRPEVRGFGSEVIPGFGPSMVIQLEPLYNKGFAWLEESFPKPWYATILFRAVAEDHGNIRILLSDEITTDSEYIVVIGDDENSVSRIYKSFQDGIKSVCEVSAKKNPLAKVTPGIVENYWISLNKGFIVVGKGEPGLGVIMSWRDPAPIESLNRLGFGSNKKPVRFAEVQRIDYPLVTRPASYAYLQSKGAASLGSKSAPAWALVRLSPADAGALSFALEGEGEAIISLAQNQTPNAVGYDVVFGANNNSSIDLRRHESGEVVATIDVSKTPEYKLSAKQQQFWISLYKGIVIVGHGAIGTNPILIWQEVVEAGQSAAKGIECVGFASGGGSSKVSNVAWWPEVEIDFGEERSSYAKTRELSAIASSLKVFPCFEYRIEQRGPLMVFKDRLGLGEWIISNTPEPGATYSFRLVVEENGAPNVQLLYKDESQQTIECRRSAAIKSATSDALFRAAQTTSMVSSGGMGIFGLVGMGMVLGATAGLSGAAVKQAKSAAESQAQLTQIQEQANRYIFSEQPAIDARAKTVETPTTAIENKQTITTRLDEIRTLQLSTLDGLEEAVKRYKEVVLLVDHPVIVDGPLKPMIINGINDLAEKVQRQIKFPPAASDEDTKNRILNLYNDIFEMITTAYDNTYLTDITKDEDKKRKGDWYQTANRIFKKFCQYTEMRNVRGIDINFKGEYLWLPEQLPSSGKGLVFFETQAQADVFIGFAKAGGQVRNSKAPFYEIVFGKWDNTQVAISRKSLGDPVVEYDDEKYPDLLLAGDKFKPFWVNINNGVITIGKGLPDMSNKLASWKDPYPAKPMSYVGFSNWYSEVIIRNMMVFASLEELTKSGQLAAMQQMVNQAVTQAAAAEAGYFEEAGAQEEAEPGAAQEQAEAEAEPAEPGAGGDEGEAASVEPVVAKRVVKPKAAQAATKTVPAKQTQEKSVSASTATAPAVVPPSTKPAAVTTKKPTQDGTISPQVLQKRRKEQIMRQQAAAAA